MCCLGISELLHNFLSFRLFYIYCIARCNMQHKYFAISLQRKFVAFHQSGQINKLQFICIWSCLVALFYLNILELFKGFNAFYLLLFHFLYSFIGGFLFLFVCRNWKSNKLISINHPLEVSRIELLKWPLFSINCAQLPNSA